MNSEAFLFFPQAAGYPGLADGPVGAWREARAGYGSGLPTERHVQCVWYDAVWRPRTLRTSNGECVEILDPGQWNLEAGPDFLDAVLRVGSDRRMLRGDVEVHLRAADWTRHGHAADRAYAGVVAHVVYEEAAGGGETLPVGAIRIPLRKALASNPVFSFEAVDVAAYPYALPETPRPCAKTLHAWSPDRIKGLLESAGQYRLGLKTARMAEAMKEKGAGQALYEETMTALGYKHNKGAFRELAARVSLKTLRSIADGKAMRAYALLLGVAGLMPDRSGSDWDAVTRRFVRGLWDTWWKRRTEWAPLRLARDQWRLSGIRPQNHPRRRLAAAAALFGGTFRLEDELSAGLRDGLAPARAVRHAVQRFQESSRMEYWMRRLSFSGERTDRDVALVGERRASEIFINVALPFMAASGVFPTDCLDCLPVGEDNACVRRAAHALFGCDHNPALYRNGLVQQGLLQIFYDFCVHGHAACERCRLTAALVRQTQALA